MVLVRAAFGLRRAVGVVAYAIGTSCFARSVLSNNSVRGGGVGMISAA